MIEVTLKSGDEIRIPLHVDDAKSESWFQMAAFERELETLGVNCEIADFIQYVTAGVKSVVDIPDDLAFGLPVRLMMKREWELTPEFIVSVSKKEVKSSEITILSIYRHLLFVVRNFKPVEFPIQYAEQEWDITPNLKKVAYPGEFTAQETVEVLKLEQMFESELAEARKKEFNFAQIAASDFGLTKFQVAILLRPIDDDGAIEPLPIGEQAIEQYINERVEELGELPYSVILSVRFFFLNTLTAVSVWSAVTENLQEQ